MSSAVASTASLPETQPQTQPAINETPEKASRKDWIAVFGMVLGGFIAILDIQIVNSSLADIQGSLSATVAEGSWITTSYMIAEIIIIPLSAWLASVFSLRRYLLWSVSGFIVMSALCGTAQSLNSMILFRALQGIAVAPLIPLSFSFIRTRLPEKQQPVGMALFSFSATFAPAIGPTIGGWLTQQFSWHLIFYINFLPGILILMLLANGLESGPMHMDRLKNADWSGIISLSISLATLEYVLEEGNRHNWLESSEITTISVITAVSLAAFVYIQLSKRDPLLNLRILGQRQFLLGTLANCAMGLAMYGSVFLLPVFMSEVHGYNSLQIGEVMLWGGAPQLLLIPLLPKIMERFDTRLLPIFGLGLFAISALMNTHMSNDYAGEQLRLSLIIRSIGQPFIMIPLSVLTTSRLSMKDISSASSLFNTTRNLSGAVGISILSTLLVRRTTFHEIRIGETVDVAGQMMQQYLTTISDAMPALTHQQQLALVVKKVMHQSLVMSFNDAFFVIACSVILGACAVAFMHPQKSA